MNESFSTSIPETVNELLTIFKENLSSVAFPDISHEILQKLVLEVGEQENALEAAKKQVEQAQQAFDGTIETLLQKCARGLAYAKVYAEGDDGLTARLAAINLGKSGRTVKRSAPVEKRKSDTGAAVVQKQKRPSAEEKKDTEK